MSFCDHLAIDYAVVGGPPLPLKTDQVGVVAARRTELELLDEHALRQMLATAPVIEQAKGLLMGYYRIDADQAWATLREWSSTGNVKVRDLAENLVRAAKWPGPTPFKPISNPPTRP